MQFIAIQILDRKPIKFRGFVDMRGKIMINDDFWETFRMSLAWWKPEDYERQWKEGLARIKTHDNSCLITRIQDPNAGPYIDWWLLYKEGNQIIIHNEILFREYYDAQIGTKDFTIDNCYDFINPQRTKMLDDGTAPSTWIVDIADSQWYNNL